MAIEALYSSILPYGEASPVFPFSGVVVNMNVCTKSHRDPMDRTVCLVMPIGDFEGGELCLVEPRMVVELQNGDWLVFQSKHVTHFNLPYQGKRASMVLHSDSHGQYWCNDRNGWLGNKYFCT